jgi:hypothetical protein
MDIKKLFPETTEVNKITYEELVTQYRKMISYLKDRPAYTDQFIQTEIDFAEKILQTHLGHRNNWK